MYRMCFIWYSIELRSTSYLYLCSMNHPNIANILHTKKTSFRNLAPVARLSITSIFQAIINSLGVFSSCLHIAIGQLYSWHCWLYATPVNWQFYATWRRCLLPGNSSVYTQWDTHMPDGLFTQTNKQKCIFKYG